MADRLADKVAIVTGGASGMGAAEARLFAREGAVVIIADLTDDDGIALQNSIRDAGGEAEFVHTNVTSEADWEALITHVFDTYGRLDVLVNNAGLSSTSQADDLSTEGWHNIMDVNATGVFLGVKHAAEAMRRASQKPALARKLPATAARSSTSRRSTAWSAATPGIPRITPRRRRCATSARRWRHVWGLKGSGSTRSIRASCPQCAAAGG